MLQRIIKEMKEVKEMKLQDSLLTSKIKCITAMFLFGTIGIFVHYIPLQSSVIAFVRGIIGTLFLLLITLVTKNKLLWEDIKKNLFLLCLSGAFIGINWILLFESYRYTSVATATLCYYMAPIFVIVASPFLLKETLSRRKVCCVIVALTGMVFVSGIIQTGISLWEVRGISCGIGAAVFYSLVIISNKKMKPISSYDKTIVQLFIAAVVVLPYIFIIGDIKEITLTPVSIGLLFVVGIVHTGLAYTLYFGSMKDLKAQTVAIFSYIDPVVAIILSALLLKEKMETTGMIGAVLILGAALFSELPEKENGRKKKT